MLRYRIYAALACVYAAACSPGGDATKDTASIAAAPAPRRLEGFPDAVVSRLNSSDSAAIASAGPLDSAGRERVRSVIQLSKRWRPGDVLLVAFNGGSKQSRDSIAAAALTWTRFANVAFDFWTDAQRTQYREWSPQDPRYTAHVRIAFEPDGFWSYLGREAIDPKYAGHTASSLNLDGFDLSLPSYWREVVLHEFGHVLALQHEHQNPLSTCEAEFRWDDEPGYVPTRGAGNAFVTDANGRQPGIYRVLGGPPNNWSRVTVDFNLRQLAFGIDLDADAFDPQSIMKYFFEPWMFRAGNASTCFAPDALQLSAGDQAAAARHYPPRGIAAKPRDQELRDVVAATSLSPAARTALLNAIRTMSAGQAATSAGIPSTARPVQ